MPGFDDFRPLQSLRELFEKDVEEIRKKLERFGETLDEMPGVGSGGRARGLPEGGPQAAEPMGRGRAMMHLLGVQPRGPTPQTQEAFKALGGELGGLASKAAGVASVFVAIVQKIKETIESLQRLRDEQLASAEQLRRFSGKINEQQALLEKQQVELSFRTARATQGTSARLLESERDRNEAWQRWNEFQENVENVFAEGFNRISEVVGNASSQIAEIGMQILQWLQLVPSDEDRREEQRKFYSIFDEIKRGEWGPRNPDE